MNIYKAVKLLPDAKKCKRNHKRSAVFCLFSSGTKCTQKNAQIEKTIMHSVVSSNISRFERFYNLKYPFIKIKNQLSFTFSAN